MSIGEPRLLRPEMPPMSDPAKTIVELCAFVVGGEEYAIDIMRIREIIQPVRITSVPRASPIIAGVFNLRGAIIPVIDLRKRLSLPPAPWTKKTKLIICLVGKVRVGLVVDAVTEVIRIPRSAIQRAPELVAPMERFFLGVCGPPDRIKLLLNVKALLEPVEAPGAEARALARQGR
jgi:purine-binding chemotaxis protein CheW